MLVDVETAVEVFVSGLCALKSRTYPYISERVDDCWVCRDYPPKKNPRKSEVVGLNQEPSKLVKIARSRDIGWHFIVDTVADEDRLDSKRDGYKELEYRKLSTNWLFAHDLCNIPQLNSEPPPRKVESLEQWKSIKQTVNQEVKLSPDSEMFCVWNESGDRGWASSLALGEYSYAHSFYVREEFRRRGYGAALISKLLQNDSENKRSTSILVSSSAGTMLYPKLGYKLVATLQTFCPIDR